MDRRRQGHGCVWVLLGLLGLMYSLSGCTTRSSQSSVFSGQLCERPARLTRAWQFQTCMTGPWTRRWHQGSCPIVRGKLYPDVRFNVLVLPAACRAYDLDGDRDVDLRDLQRFQNGPG